MDSSGTVSVAGPHAGVVSSSEPPVARRAPDLLSIDCLQSETALEQIKPIWQALERRDYECTPFNTWLWLSTWWKHYARSSDELVLLVARDAGRVVAIAPLYVERARMCRVIPVKVLRFLGSGRDTSPDYLNIIALPEYRESAQLAILDHLPTLSGWHKLYLSDVREQSSFARAIRQFIARQKGVALPEHHNTLLQAELPRTWEAYRQGLSRKRRKQINHRQNRLDAAGESELALCATREELNEAIDALEVLHRLRWQSKGEQGAFATRRYIRFHRNIITEFFAKDALWLATLRLNGTIIGVQYIFLWRGELQFFQSGYSPEHESLSPGHVLFTYVIEQGIEHGVNRIDMLKGDYTYKSAYAKDPVTTLNTGLVRSGFRSLLGRVVYSVK